MKDLWIPINQMEPPKNANCRIIMYTPENPGVLQYRIVHVSEWEKITDATHWQPCLDPGMEEGK